MSRQESGFTLVETLLALSLLVLVLVTASGTLMVGQRHAGKVADMEEQSQQLRLAIRQVTMDLTYARWDTAPPSSGTVNARIYQPYTVDGSENAGWPGDLDPSRDFRLTYTLTRDGTLIREILDDNYTKYTSQALISGLTLDSVLSVDAASHTVQVRLRKVMPGGTKIAEVSSKFFLR